MEQALYGRPDVYDALYASKDYESEVAFALDRLDAHGDGGNGRDRALVVGCGTGRHSALLRERGFEVVGVDPSPAMLERARDRSDATFLSGRLPDLDASFDTSDLLFDLVWAPYTVCNYLASDELAPALESLADRLADGGVLVLDLGDFPGTSAPALQVARGADRNCALLSQYRRVDADRHARASGRRRSLTLPSNSAASRAVALDRSGIRPTIESRRPRPPVVRRRPWERHR